MTSDDTQRVSYDIRDLLARIDRNVDKLDETLRLIQINGTPYEQSTRAKVDDHDKRIRVLESASAAVRAVKHAKAAIWSSAVAVLGTAISVIMLIIAVHNMHA